MELQFCKGFRHQCSKSKGSGGGESAPFFKRLSLLKHVVSTNINLGAEGGRGCQMVRSPDLELQSVVSCRTWISNLLSYLSSPRTSFLISVSLLQGKSCLVRT